MVAPEREMFWQLICVLKFKMRSYIEMNFFEMELYLR